MRSSLVALLAASFVFSCATETVVKKAPENTDPVAEETTPAEEAESFGDPLAEGVPTITLAEIIATPVVYQGKKVETTGIVRAVCQKRGCWMEVRPEEALESQALHIVFKGYSFFMPKDSRGANVRVQGSVKVTVLAKEQVAELEAEGATFDAKKPDGSVEQAVFTANGVEMLGRKK